MSISYLNYIDEEKCIYQDFLFNRISSDSKIIYESEDFNLIITFVVENNGNIKLFSLYEINEETNTMIKCDPDYQLFDWDSDYDIGDWRCDFMDETGDI